MDEHEMMTLSAFPLALVLSAFFAGGVGLGYGYFRALHRTTDLIVGKGSVALALALTLGRMVAIAVGLYLVVLAGAVALIATFVGVLVGRAFVMRGHRGAAR